MQTLLRVVGAVPDLKTAGISIIQVRTSFFCLLIDTQEKSSETLEQSPVRQLQFGSPLENAVSVVSASVDPVI